MSINLPNNLIDETNLKKLTDLNNQHVLDIVALYADRCKPARITVITDSPEDANYVRTKSLENGEETAMAMPGHTYHFDGYEDQGRDKAVTRVLVPAGYKMSKAINTMEREEGLQEMTEKLEGLMAGKEMFVAFFTLGPANSRFAIGALQITDSAYVVHAESILYRPGYEEFKRLAGSDKFFHFVHSAGELTENKTSKNSDNKRIYIDLEDNRVFAVNTQYAGNSLGLKKLALRLAIKKSHDEDWLCEHMFVMGARPARHASQGDAGGPEGKNRITYFIGAFPSACGKTSTAMIPGQSIIGDDIAYLKIGADGIAYAANVEQGIFGIIEDVNPIDDALIYEALQGRRELIFSNLLINEGAPYWLGMGHDWPDSGISYLGPWQKGDKDAEGNELKPVHKNARYTIRIKELANADSNLDNPDGVPVSGIIYGGRDYEVSPPVVESLSWAHGVFVGAILESEPTAALVGKHEKVHNPMANIDFMVVPLGVYLANHLKFGGRLDKQPKIFSTNYFLKNAEGKFLNQKVDKKVWLYWMEGRIHQEYEAIETPIGLIPKYEDLKHLFKQVFDRDYSRADYEAQFALKLRGLLERLGRIEKIYSEEEGIPPEFFEHLEQQKQRLLQAQNRFGKEIISPFDFEI
jgi:phosphoenolpyruvate carboxykinase (GTP)